MAKRKLKGKNAAKLKPEQLSKMNKTLDRMEKGREEDTVRLRKKIEDNIKAYENKLQQAEAYLKDIQAKKMRIEGALYSLKELLKNDSPNKS